jgi:hypothetical protein
MRAAQPWTRNPLLCLEHRSRDARDARLLHAQVDAHAFAGFLPLIQCKQKRVCDVVAGGVIHIVVAGPHRRAALETGEIRHAAHRIDGPCAGASGVPRAGVTEGGAAQSDDARIDLREAFVIEAEAAHRAGPEVVGHDVGVPDELQKHLFACRMRDFETQALLVARAEIREVGTFVPPLRSRLAVHERPGLAVLKMRDALDPDHLGAEIRQERSAPRQRVDLFECEDRTPSSSNGADIGFLFTCLQTK